MVTFIAPAFNEQFETYVFIGSMLCQSNPNWKAIIYHNGPNTWMKYFVSSLADPRIIYKESEVNTGAWGTYNRIDALCSIVDTEYVVQTSIQDYWIPEAVDSILSADGSDFIYWNSRNHIAGPFADLADERLLLAKPEINWIDWGNFAIKTAIAKQVGIQQPTEFTADGLFVTDVMNSGLVKNITKVESILTIHN